MTNQNNEEGMGKNPMAAIFGMMIDSSLETTSRVIELVNKYKANNIDVIPVSEIDEALKAGVKKIKDENSFTSHILSM